MGKLLIVLKYVFFLFSSDINEKRKPIHVRDRKRKISNLCKYWLEPEIALAYNKGFSKKELNEIESLVVEHLIIINAQVKLFNKGKKVRSNIIN